LRVLVVTATKKNVKDSTVAIVFTV